MTEDEIREALRLTFRSAEMIWGNASPFKHSSTWIGYSARSEYGEYLARILGKEPAKPFPTKSAGYRAVADLIRALLPPNGQALFDTGYGRETIYASAPATAWTPSVLCITLATDPDDGGRLFALITITCSSS